ncbi:hypothetical protein [Marinoscillum sp.]|uniref:hypothetical protein n=1 Tax=Marinoscillum sp. TaxID=2024838 RepID=UPI003BAC11BE
MKTAKNCIFLLILSLIYACGEEEEPSFRDTLKNCDSEIAPDIIMGTGEEKILLGTIYAEIYDDVEYIELSIDGPAFGRVDGYTKTYQVSSFPEEEWISLGNAEEPIFYWNLPFELNETNRNYNLEITYFCETENGAEPGHNAEISVTSTDFCSEISSNLTGNFDFGQPLINDDWQGPITETNFNVKFHSFFRVDQGFGLLLFPKEKADYGTVYLNNGNEFSADFPLQLTTEVIEIDAETELTEAYLSADLDLEELLNLTYDEMRGASVNFSITLCGNEFDKGSFMLQ